MKTLPLGLDIGPLCASVALYEATRGNPRLVYAESAYYSDHEGATPEAREIAAIKSLIAKLPAPQPAQHDCVIALAPEKVIVNELHIPKKRPEKEVISVAENDYRETLAGIPSIRRIFSVSPTGDPLERLVAIADRQDLDPILDEIAQAQLRAVACDVPIAVWQRMLGGNHNERKTDALLDLAGNRATLYIFPGNDDHVIGRTISMDSGLKLEEFVNQARIALINARREEFADVSKLTVFSPDAELRTAVIDALTEGYEGLSVSGLIINEIESPPWAYAFCLGTWGVATGGHLRANLIKQSAAPWDVVRRQIVSADFARSMGGFGVGIAAALVYGLGLSMYQHHLEDEAQAIQAKIAALAPQHDVAQRYVTANEQLEAVDREAKWLYRNGQLLALDMAYIGNAVPPGRRIWLNNMTQTGQGWALQGHGASMPDEAAFIQALARVLPKADTRYGDVNRANGYTFNANIVNPTPSPAPTRPPASPPPGTGGLQ